MSESDKIEIKRAKCKHCGRIIWLIPHFYSPEHYEWDWMHVGWHEGVHRNTYMFTNCGETQAEPENEA